MLRGLIDLDVLNQTVMAEEEEREKLLSRLPAAGRVIIQAGDGS